MLRTVELRDGIVMDEFVIMPNHIHGIVGIIRQVDDALTNPTRDSTLRSPSNTVGSIIRGFKGASANRINQARNSPRQAVWRRNYYEHIIRNERSLNRIREYIRENPRHWPFDPENPGRIFSPSADRSKKPWEV